MAVFRIEKTRDYTVMSNHHLRDIRIKARIDEKCLTSAGSKAAYEKILEYVLEHTGLKVSHLYILQAKQEYGIIERGIYLAEIRKRQVALMPI